MMDFEEALELVRSSVEGVLEKPAQVNRDSELIGQNALLDSMKLVELCLSLEDLADDRDFEFDWTSESALSRSRSMFRTVECLAREFIRQQEEQSP